jgi:hypothetical protein
MAIPGFTAEVSLHQTSVQHAQAMLTTARTFGSVIAQQLCRHSGQTCGGIDLFCCAGLRCTAPLGGRGICVPQRPCCQPMGCQPCPLPL